MRTFGTFLAVGILALAAGCGGGSDSKSTGGRTASNGGQCPASSSGQTCTGEDAYETCLMNACGTQYKAALGNNFASGNFAGSPCADFMNCLLKCPCDATGDSCEVTCFTQHAASGSACYTAMMAVQACVVATTCAMPVCGPSTATTTSTSTTTGTSTGTGCAGALACCTALASSGGASVVQACKDALAGQTDAVCTQFVATYKSAGLCP